MPIRIEILTSSPVFPDEGPASAYLMALAPVRKQIDDAITDFATHRIDRKIDLKDQKGELCGSVEILRF